ncbi:MAG: hypothetical protein OXU68_01610 [Bacteroidota bacterium]|nr:hypothetical protein [Bacteroidota bacterium]
MNPDNKQSRRLSIFQLRHGHREETHCGLIRMLRAKGTILQNVVAQHGLFTVRPVLVRADDPVDNASLEDYLLSRPYPFLQKLTLPAKEAFRLYDLCNRFNLNAARVLPDADGACVSVMEKFRKNAYGPRIGLEAIGGLTAL